MTWLLTCVCLIYVYDVTFLGDSWCIQTSMLFVLGTLLVKLLTSAWKVLEEKHLSPLRSPPHFSYRGRLSFAFNYGTILVCCKLTIALGWVMKIPPTRENPGESYNFKKLSHAPSNSLLVPRFSKLVNFKCVGNPRIPFHLGKQVINFLF